MIRVGLAMQVEPDCGQEGWRMKHYVLVAIAGRHRVKLTTSKVYHDILERVLGMRDVPFDH